MQGPVPYGDPPQPKARREAEVQWLQEGQRPRQGLCSGDKTAFPATSPGQLLTICEWKDISPPLLRRVKWPVCLEGNVPAQKHLVWETAGPGVCFLPHLSTRHTRDSQPGTAGTSSHLVWYRCWALQHRHMSISPSSHEATQLPRISLLGQRQVHGSQVHTDPP